MSETEDLDKLLDETEPQDFATITPGTYAAKVANATYEEGKDDKPDRVQFEFDLTEEGEFFNRKIWVNNQVNVQGMPFLVTNFAKLGVKKPAKVADIPMTLEGALGKEVTLKVVNKKKPDGSGVWVNAYIQAPDEPETDGADPKFTESDIPF